MTTSTPTADRTDGSVISEYGKQNMFATEVQMQMEDSYSNYPEEAEKANGRWAMIGFIALLGAYVSTGQVIPGIF
nr:high light inducible protein [Prochlorococcus sp. MIT 1223]